MRRTPFVLCLLLAGCWGHASDSVSNKLTVAPYLDVTTADRIPVAQRAIAGGLRSCIASFVVGGGEDLTTPFWGEFGPADGVTLRDVVSLLKSNRVDVGVSFGGAKNQCLASAPLSPAALAAAYERVTIAYGFSLVDFDVEGDALRDLASIEKRAKAWNLWRKKGTMPRTVLTLPVSPDGLAEDALSVVRTHVQQGALPDCLNLMVMNFGEYYSGRTDRRMFDLAVAALDKAVAQCLAAGWPTRSTVSGEYAHFGLTPMIGVNAVTNEVFRLTDAKMLSALAGERSLGMLSYWSLNRDRNGSGQEVDLHRWSAVKQADNAFFRVLSGKPAFSPVTACVYKEDIGSTGHQLYLLSFTNGSDATIDSWELRLDRDVTILTSWGEPIQSKTHAHGLVVSRGNSDPSVAPNESISFALIAKGSLDTAQFYVNGAKAALRILVP